MRLSDGGVGYRLPMAVSEAAARAGGAVLAGAVRVLSALRPSAKPLHPRGEVRSAVLRRFGTPPDDATGVPWLDEPGEDRVLVRRSNAVGLPTGWPDVRGLALRLEMPGGGDLLLATTGTGRWTRFLLRPARDAHSAPLTSLLPYRGPKGALLLAADPFDGEKYCLRHARPGGTWTTFGELEVGREQHDSNPSFDPVTRPLPGLRFPSWVARLREPSYRAARRSRSTTPRG